MYTVLIISVIIVIIVLILSVVTTSKAYQFKHTVDPIDNNDSHEAAAEAKAHDENK
ncbi:MULTISPECIES: YtzI protein [Mesobacillus]|uniref:YtzI protein n=1 Tax=Mesobacillus selenatarsenatis TaxID=388741 RepID=A0A846U2H0_9BACI|nr:MULTISPECIES: YtzI protein [Mesobacillus]NKE07996.1 YtzI protein [Mesobacillus selenatarsenatis]